MIHIAYNISASDAVVEFIIVSQLTKQVLERRTLFWQQSSMTTGIANGSEPIYLVLHAYSTRSPSSVTILSTHLFPGYTSKLTVISLCS